MSKPGQYILKKGRKLPFAIDEKKTKVLRVGPDTITVTLYAKFNPNYEFDMNVDQFHKWFKKRKKK